MSFRAPDTPSVAVIGLGYVGLPIAAAFAKKLPTTGFDINTHRIEELRNGEDATLELTSEELTAAADLQFSDEPSALSGHDVYIVTVPTPIDKHKRPDMSALRASSATVGRAIKPGAVVVYESTVYPGATEEVCIPILEKESGLTFNKDFFAGYSPERINPGDKQHRLESIVKVTSGSTPEVADFVDALYGKVVTAGTHKASSIRVAEAAKVIENTQRDLNIALVNELALIFHRLGIDTLEVLEAAGTKWNFLPFRPGLVGGHCIGVDPYYLTHKAEEIGYQPNVILAGRSINDSMGEQVVAQLVKLMIQRRVCIAESRVLVLGLTFKENCPDLRNSRVIDIINELGSYNIQADCHDAWADASDVEREFGLAPIQDLQPNNYDAIILAVAHNEYQEMGAEQIRALGNDNAIIYDVKSMLPFGSADARL